MKVSYEARKTGRSKKAVKKAVNEVVTAASGSRSDGRDKVLPT